MSITQSLDLETKKDLLHALNRALYKQHAPRLLENMQTIIDAQQEGLLDGLAHAFGVDFVQPHKSPNQYRFESMLSHIPELYQAWDPVRMMFNESMLDELRQLGDASLDAMMRLFTYIADPGETAQLGVDVLTLITVLDESDKKVMFNWLACPFTLAR